MGGGGGGRGEGDSTHLQIVFFIASIRDAAESCKAITETELYLTYTKGFFHSNVSLWSEKMVSHRQLAGYLTMQFYNV